jgi:diacylglycerol kinase family enzyme
VLHVRVLVVCNLLAGSGDAALYDFVHVLGRSECEITLRYFSGEGALGDLVHDADRYDRIVVAGGDGTVSGIAYTLRNTGIPILAYPAGTANLISSNLGITLDPVALAKLTVSDRYTSFDVGEITRLGGDDELPEDKRRGFMVAAGAGFDAAIMDAAQPLKASMGVLAYLAGVMQNLTPARSSFRVYCDGHETVSEGIAVLVVNFSRIQFDLQLTHGSSPRDGQFEVAIARARTAVGLIPAVWDALIDRVVPRPERAALEVYSTREVVVEADPPLRIQYDGDVIDSTTPLGARVLPGAATLLVPPASRHARAARSTRASGTLDAV